MREIQINLILLVSLPISYIFCALAKKTFSRKKRRPIFSFPPLDTSTILKSNDHVNYILPFNKEE